MTTAFMLLGKTSNRPRLIEEPRDFPEGARSAEPGPPEGPPAAAAGGSDRAVALLAAILGELVAIRRELRHQPGDGGAGELIAALAEYFGPGRFTTAGVLQLADENPHGIGAVIGELIDMNLPAHARAVALGRLLSRLPEVEVVVRSGGVAVYRPVGGSTPDSP